MFDAEEYQDELDELEEQAEDAFFREMISVLAAEEGEILMADFEAAQARGEVEPVPEGLDQRIQEMIRKSFAERKSKEHTMSL